MNPVEELEAILTLDQAHEFLDADSSVDRGLSTQQLLDDLLGRFDEDDALMLIANGAVTDFAIDSDE